MFRVVEELARIDSATGWNVSLANSSEPFGAWFPDGAAEEVFGVPGTTMAGAFNPPRRAVRVDGGFELTGRTTFNSNCHAANWILGLANIYDGDEAPLDESGAPETLVTLFRTDDAQIIDNWDTLGMRGTGSHDLNVDSLFVPEERAVPFVPLEVPGSAYSGPLHRLSIWPSVGLTAVTALGIARAAVDDFTDSAGSKVPSYTEKSLRDRPIVQLRLAQAEAKVAAARAFFFGTFDEMWHEAQAGNNMEMADRAKCQLATSHAVMSAAEAVDLIHSIVGTSGIRNEQNYQKYFRDIHVITQHAFISESRLEAVGQVSLGLEPDWPFFQF